MAPDPQFTSKKNHSSAQTHVQKLKNPILSNFFILDEINDWKKYLNQTEGEGDLKKLRLHEETGRPLGEDIFVKKLGLLSGRQLMKKKPGPKQKNI